MLATTLANLRRFYKKLRQRTIIFAVAFFVFAAGSVALSAALPGAVQAQTPTGGNLGTALSEVRTPLPTIDPRQFIANLIRAFLGLLGLIALVLFLYGGYLYMTSAGNPEKVDRAKTLIRNAIIGLVIIVSSYGIATFIFSILLGPGGVRGIPGGPGGGPGGALGTLGGGILESHYPARNATGIPRNTKIIVTFKEPMQLDTIINDNKTPDPVDDRIVAANIRIRKTADNASTGPFLTNVRAAVTEDKRTFVFAPLDLLGSSTASTSYTVLLGSGIKKANGNPAFGALGSYDWKFDVSTEVDNTPPQIESVIPEPDSTNPRNVIVQINFTEAIDPTTASGTVAQGKFTNITVRDKSNNALVEGTYSVANMYRTVEFITTDLCGKNSCGQDVFCLPADKDLAALLKAASVDASPPAAKFPYDGIVDVSGNALDGNKDNKAEGSPADNFAWSFKTTSEIDLIPPKIEATNPIKLTSKVPLDKPVDISFSKLMSYTSLNTDNVTLDQGNYWISGINKNDKTIATINHDAFLENTKYQPSVGSGVKDIYQNCYNPCIGP